MTNKRYFLLAGIVAFIGLVGISCSIYSENYPIVSPTSVPATQPPTDIPTQTAIPFPTFPPSPTVAPPYPTASVVKANAVVFIEGNSLWIANVDGSGERKLTDIENNASSNSKYLLQWSPDGKWISYISGDNLWIISPDGLVKRKVLLISKTDNKDRIWSYDWSPDSSKIAYIQTVNEKLTSWLLDLDTGNVSKLPTTPQISLAWSPDGRYILLNTYTSLTVFGVATGKVLKEINSMSDTQNHCPIEHGGVTWSPNSKWFYHPMYTNGEYHMSICVSGIDGPSKRIYISSSSHLPAWDKTGNFLYFTTQDTKQRLLQYNLRTQETKTMLALEASQSSIWSVSVSPNGHMLEMDGTIPGNQQLFIFLNLDSLSIKKFEIPEIPYHTIFWRITAWSADNQNLIFSSEKNNHTIFYRLDSQTGKTNAFSGEHSIEYWIASPIATTP